jgi:2-dehydro-3-deoxygluconokinase
MDKKFITFGEALLRLSAPGYLRIEQASELNVAFGGAELNVAVSLSRFGKEVEFIARIPENEIGDACLAYIRKYNIGLSNIVRGGSRLGLYYYETGAAQRPSLVLYDRANSGAATIEPGMVNWAGVFSSVGWFHFSGITASLSESSAKVCLEAVTEAKRLGIIVSCDLNYRSKLWNWGKEAIDVMSELVRHCDVIIGNEEDAEKSLGVKAPETDITKANLKSENYLVVCEELSNTYPNLQTIVFTLRGSLSASHNTWSGVLWNKDKGFFSGVSYDIKPIVDRLGGGDSFSAGIIFGLTEFKDDYQKALDFALSASCLKHSIQDDFNLVSLDEVFRLMKGDASGRVSR